MGADQLIPLPMCNCGGQHSVLTFTGNAPAFFSLTRWLEFEKSAEAEGRIAAFKPRNPARQGDMVGKPVSNLSGATPEAVNMVVKSIGPADVRQEAKTGYRRIFGTHPEAAKPIILGGITTPCVSKITTNKKTDVFGCLMPAIDANESGLCVPACVTVLPRIVVFEDGIETGRNGNIDAKSATIDAVGVAEVDIVRLDDGMPASKYGGRIMIARGGLCMDGPCCKKGQECIGQEVFHGCFYVWFCFFLRKTKRDLCFLRSSMISCLVGIIGCILVATTSSLTFSQILKIALIDAIREMRCGDIIMF